MSPLSEARARHPAITMNDVSLSHPAGAGKILDRTSYEFLFGRLYCVAGQNGCGKTTFLNMLSGLIRPDRGQILFGAAAPTRHDPLTIQRTGVGLTRSFQKPVLVDGATVQEHLELAFRGDDERFMSLFSVRKPGLVGDRRTASDKCLRDFGLQDVAGTPVQSLSYGVRRLIGTLTTLLNPAGVILLDEPFANMDDDWRRKLNDRFKNEAMGGRCLVVVEHAVSTTSVPLDADVMITLNSGLLASLDRCEMTGASTESSDAID